MSTPMTGTAAPGIVLLDQHAERVDLAALRGPPVLARCYPTASVPGCTQQECALRDIADQIGDTVVVGISPDLPTAQRSFTPRKLLEALGR